PGVENDEEDGCGVQRRCAAPAWGRQGRGGVGGGPGAPPLAGGARGSDLFGAEFRDREGGSAASPHPVAAPDVDFNELSFARIAFRGAQQDCALALAEEPVQLRIGDEPSGPPVLSAERVEVPGEVRGDGDFGLVEDSGDGAVVFLFVVAHSAHAVSSSTPARRHSFFAGPWIIPASAKVATALLAIQVRLLRQWGLRRAARRAAFGSSPTAA